MSFTYYIYFNASFHVDYGHCEAFKFARVEDQAITHVSFKADACQLTNQCHFALQPNELFDGWKWVNLGLLEKVGTTWSGATAK